MCECFEIGGTTASRMAALLQCLFTEISKDDGLQGKSDISSWRRGIEWLIIRLFCIVSVLVHSNFLQKMPIERTNVQISITFL